MRKEIVPGCRGGDESVSSSNRSKQFVPVIGKREKRLILLNRSLYFSAKLVLDVLRSTWKGRLRDRGQGPVIVQLPVIKVVIGI